MHDKITLHYSNFHVYVGVAYSYLRKEKSVQFDMDVYLKEAIFSFPDEITKTNTTSTTQLTFDVNEESEKPGRGRKN